MQEWLSHELNSGKAALFTLKMVPLVFLLMIAISALMQMIIGVRLDTRVSDLFRESLAKGQTLKFMAVIVAVVMIEEVIFRLIPLVLVQWRRNRDIRLIVGTILISSAVFGYVHGGFENIPLQGVMGVFYSLQYLKCGGWSGRHLRGLIWAFLAHLFHNCIVFGVLFLFVRGAG